MKFHYRVEHTFTILASRFFPRRDWWWLGLSLPVSLTLTDRITNSILGRINVLCHSNTHNNPCDTRPCPINQKLVYSKMICILHQYLGNPATRMIICFSRCYVNLVIQSDIWIPRVISMSSSRRKILIQE